MLGECRGDREEGSWKKIMKELLRHGGEGERRMRELDGEREGVEETRRGEGGEKGGRGEGREGRGGEDWRNE